jgi:hypothetical protein
MKICWDNLEKLRLVKSGKYFIHIENKNKYYHFDKCPECGESYLGQTKSIYCSRQCSIKNNEVMSNTKGKKNPFYGKEHSKKVKKRMGSKISQAWKNGNYDNVIWLNDKENNPNWKGGNYCECGELIHKQRLRCDECYNKYREKVKNKRLKEDLYPSNWNSIAKKIRKRDNYKCQNPYCNQKVYIKLEVHHIDYNKHNYIDENLISLCTVCHIQTNYSRNWHWSFYSEIIRRKYMGGVLTLRRMG